MIPKIIHYCWFGRNPLPPLALKCIASWRSYLPEYEIREWNESNFDVNGISYTRDAYKAGKYAFVSDYARFWILYHYGGVYFDTDVEVIRSLDDILAKGAFMGCERDDPAEVNPGLGIACPAELNLYKELLDFYATLNFIREDGTYNLTTIVCYTTSLLKKYGLSDRQDIQQIGDITIYPREYFCPQSPTGKRCFTSHTRTVHHYAGSWATKSQRMNAYIGGLLPVGVTRLLMRISAGIKKLK